MPDRMPEDMSEYMLEDMPDRMPDRMPEDMSNKMQENMPDKMPKDLPNRKFPVRKYINITVGIIKNIII